MKFKTLFSCLNPFVGWLFIAIFILTSASAAAEDSEVLLYAPPEGFQLKYQDTMDNYRLQEWVPEAESVDDWSQMFTLTDSNQLKNMEPRAFFHQIGNKWNEACPEFGGRMIYEGSENGYSIAVWYLYCPNNPMTGKPEFTYFKGFSGTQGFYTAQFAFAVKSHEMKQEFADQAMNQFYEVRLCDEALPDLHPCEQ